MSIVIEAQRETNENLFDNDEMTICENIVSHKASKTQTMQRQSRVMEASENVPVDLSTESITVIHNHHPTQVMMDS